MKRLTKLTVMSLALVGIVALAKQRSEEVSAESKTGENSRSGYVQKIRVQLEKWETRLSGFQEQHRQYDSIDNYMAMEDLDLLIKEVRGDLTKLLARPGIGNGDVCSIIDGKMADVERLFTQVSPPEIGCTA